MSSRMEIAVNQAIADFDSIKAAIESKGIEVPQGTDTKDYAALIKAIAGSSKASTYILRDEAGAELVATVVGEETVFTATANDIREGMVAATDEGVTTGTKVIPSYHTVTGYRVIPSGGNFAIQFTDELYDFTKLQAIICPFADSIANSVAAEKVAIDEKVYAVNSAVSLATVIRDNENKTINLGIVNESEAPYLLRYFTYKEIY